MTNLETTVEITRYKVTSIPRKYWNISGAEYLALAVEVRGEDSWVVTDGFRATYDREGNMARESLPSSRTDAYLQQYRFGLEEALEIAQRIAPTLKIGRYDVESFIEACEKGEIE